MDCATIQNWELSAVIIRCGCTDEEKQSPEFHALFNQPCPKPLAVEDKGIIARG